MHWAVVKFTKEEAVEAVPESWFIKESQECFWPPNTCKREKIFRLIEQCDGPLTDWGVYPAMILGCYDNFATAQKKAKKALLTTDLSSNTDTYNKGRGSRRRKKNPRYNSESDFNSSEEVVSSSEEDTNSYPLYRKKITGSLTLSEPKKKKRPNSTPPGDISTLCEPTKNRRSNSIPPEDTRGMESNNNSHISTTGVIENISLFLPNAQPNVNNYWETPTASVSRSTQRERNIPADQDPMPRDNEKIRAREKDMPTDQDFKRLVMDELSQINLKIDSLLDKVGTLVNTSRLQKTMEFKSYDIKVKELYEKLPVQNEDKLNEMEGWLGDDNNYRIMISELGRIGGKSMGQCARKIVYRIVSDEVALLFSWDGAKLKNAFKNLKLSKAILDAVKIQHESTEAEIIEIIKYWLVKAKERIARKEKISLQTADPKIN